MAVGGLSLVTAYLVQNDLITIENSLDVLAPCGRGPISQAAMLMSFVEFKIRKDPDFYFPKFTDALRQSGLGYLAEELKQQGYLPLEHKRLPGTSATHRPTCTCTGKSKLGSYIFSNMHVRCSRCTRAGVMYLLKPVYCFFNKHTVA